MNRFVRLYFYVTMSFFCVIGFGSVAWAAGFNQITVCNKSYKDVTAEFFAGDVTEAAELKKNFGKVTKSYSDVTNVRIKVDDSTPACWRTGRTSTVVNPGEIVTFKVTGRPDSDIACDEATCD